MSKSLHQAVGPPKTTFKVTGDPIPFDCLQAARNLRNRISVDDHAFIAGLDALLKPIKARHVRKPIPRRDMMIKCLNEWRKLGQFSRIALRLAGPDEIRKGIGIADLRVYCSQLHDKDWADENYELTVNVGTVVLVWQPHNLTLRTSAIVSVSLHTLGRFMQRSPIPTKDALFASFTEIVGQSPPLLAADEPFELETKHGRWHGLPCYFAEDGEQGHMLTMRTFKESRGVKLSRIIRQQESLP